MCKSIKFCKFIKLLETARTVSKCSVVMILLAIQYSLVGDGMSSLVIVALTLGGGGGLAGLLEVSLSSKLIKFNDGSLVNLLLLFEEGVKNLTSLKNGFVAERVKLELLLLLVLVYFLGGKGTNR